MPQALVLSLLLVGFAPTPLVMVSDTPAPTATEIFNLRSECAALGEKILGNNVVGTTHRYLFDGQTSEILAAVLIEKGDRSGVVYDLTSAQPVGNDAGFASATKYIDDRMADDRTR
jgi:hypothetical protein